MEGLGFRVLAYLSDIEGTNRLYFLSSYKPQKGLRFNDWLSKSGLGFADLRYDVPHNKPGVWV